MVGLLWLLPTIFCSQLHFTTAESSPKFRLANRNLSPPEPLKVPPEPLKVIDAATSTPNQKVSTMPSSGSTVLNTTVSAMNSEGAPKSELLTSSSDATTKNSENSQQNGFRTIESNGALFIGLGVAAIVTSAAILVTKRRAQQSDKSVALLGTIDEESWQCSSENESASSTDAVPHTESRRIEKIMPPAIPFHWTISSDVKQVLKTGRLAKFKGKILSVIKKV